MYFFKKPDEMESNIVNLSLRNQQVVTVCLLFTWGIYDFIKHNTLGFPITMVFMSTIPFWSSILQYRNQLFKGMNNKVHYYRSKLKMSQQELANRLNVSVETIIAIENEKYTPTLALAFNISKLLHAPIEEIFKYD